MVRSAFVPVRSVKMAHNPEEDVMLRKIALSLATSVTLTAGLFAGTTAQAFTSAGAGLAAAASDAANTQQVQYRCTPRWRCGPYGCGYVQICSWRPAYSYGYGSGYYSPRYSYGPRYNWGNRPWRSDR